MLKKCFSGVGKYGLRHITLNLVLLLSALSCVSVVQAKHLVVFGDSLSAAYGMELDQGWVHLVAQKLGTEHTVTNASISGETTVGGLARLPQTLTELQPDVVVLELGANDGLRGYPIPGIKTNLGKMIKLIESSGAIPVLAGISVPPSYGFRYMDQFRNAYRQLAQEYTIPFIDLYNESFVTTPGFIQQDGLHPTAIGQPIISESVLLFLNQQGIFE